MTQTLPTNKSILDAQSKPTCASENCGAYCLACYGTCDNCHALTDKHDLFPIKTALICHTCYYRYFDINSKTEKKFWKNFKG